MSGNDEKSNVLKKCAQLLDYFKRTNSLQCSCSGVKVTSRPVKQSILWSQC